MSPSLRCSFVSLSIILLCSGVPFAQSFDCAKAKSKAEKLICESDELKQLDIELSKLYKEILRDPNKNKTRIEYWQHGWLEYRDLYANYRDNNYFADIYRTRIVELLIWLKESSPKATPFNTKSKWGEDEKRLLAEMYDAYKKDGFDWFYWLGADRELCPVLIIDFMKLNFEPVSPIKKTTNPKDADFKNAMGSCGYVDLSILYTFDYTGCFMFSSYTLFKGNFDGMKENGEELFLIAEKPSMDNIPRAYTGPCATRPDTTNDAAVALLLNPYDNCSREVNRDLRVYFSKYENEPLENGKHSWGSAARQGSIHALWYSKFPGETLHYGVARYEGRDYAYEFHTKDSQYDLGLMDTGRYVCSGTINVAK